MVANTAASRKAKGRQFQKWVRDSILALFPSLTSDDVRSTSMGASGEDVLLSSRARELFPYSIECKNTEKVNVWAAYEQACGRSHTPLLFIKRNRTEPLVVLSAEHFFQLTAKKNNDKNTDAGY